MPESPAMLIVEFAVRGPSMLERESEVSHLLTACLLMITSFSLVSFLTCIGSSRPHS